MVLAPTSVTSVGPGPIPASAGIGLRGPHYHAVLEHKPAVAWLEVHSENFFGAGGSHRYFLEKIRADYPLSMHGVGLSIGSSDDLDQQHLSKLKRTVDYFQPDLVSEHLCWGSVGGRHLNDLLPLPYTEEALRHMIEQIKQVQDYLGRQILIENVSSYLEYKISTIPEWEFLTAVAEQADCGILLDVNNIYVNARNHGFVAMDYINAIPVERVQEIHLAGFTVNQLDGGEILIDTHSRPVCEDVWALFEKTLQYLGPKPTLIEWDSELPELAVLVAEAQRAETFINKAQHDLVA